MTPPLSEMSGPPAAAAPATSRAEVEERILAALRTPGAAARPPIVLLEAPRGYGKQEMLDRIAARLRDGGRTVIRCDMDGAGTAADLARTFPALFGRALFERSTPASPGMARPRTEATAESIAAALAARPTEPSQLLEHVFSFPQALARDRDVHPILLVDEIGEVMRITHAETREAIGVIATCLAASDRIALLASVSPPSRAAAFTERLAQEAAAAGRALIVENLPPLAPADLPHGLDPGTRAALLAVTGGRPRHVHRLVPHLLSGRSLTAAILAEMTPREGILWQEMRFDYGDLVHRCRGDAAVRSVLTLLAGTGGRTLTEIARHLRIAPPTALDYLRWMHEVDLIRRPDRHYTLSDPLLRVWILLRDAARRDHAARSDHAAREEDAPAARREEIVRHVVEDALAPGGFVPQDVEPPQRVPAGRAAAAAGPPRNPASRPPSPTTAPVAADPTDRLMEID